MHPRIKARYFYTRLSILSIDVSKVKISIKKTRYKNILKIEAAVTVTLKKVLKLELKILLLRKLDFSLDNLKLRFKIFT